MNVFDPAGGSTVSADSPEAAVQVLHRLADEIRSRAAEAARRDLEVFPGPNLRLTINGVDQFLVDPAARHLCADLIAQILKFGRKPGLTGVAYGREGSAGELSIIDPAGHVIRSMLLTGVPLEYQRA